MDILVTIAGAQGLFIGAYLCLSNNAPLSFSTNFWLGLLLIELSSFILIPSLVRQYAEVFPHLIATSFPILFLIGPTVWIYVNKLSNREFTGLKSSFHFIPFFIVTLYLTDFYVQSSDYKLSWLTNVKNQGLPFIYNTIWVFSCVHIFTYFYFATAKLSEYKHYLEENHSNLAYLNLTWVSFFTRANVFLWSSYLLIFFLFQMEVLMDPYGITDKLFAIGQGLLIYGITHQVLRKPELFNTGHIVSKVNKKYEKTGLSKHEAHKKFSDLMVIMKKDKPYLNPDLTLNELAAMAEVQPKQLSQLINQYHGKKFYEFINEFRVEESKILLEKAELKILAIAFESGFRSKSTFNSA
ncbi:MAG: helix-turn-helix domain-containing protein, partial [Bacteroidota bacterium]